MPVSLNSVEYGAGRPVVILHGLFGSVRNWHSIALRLSERHRVCVLDLRNHGASAWADSMTYPELAADVGEYMDRHGIRAAPVVGHSMGGKAAMTLALQQPDRVTSLAVLDIAPVPYQHDHLGLIRALRELNLGAVRSRRDADNALASTITEVGVRQFLLQNLVAKDGHFDWRINLDALASCMDDITGFPDSLTGASYGGEALFLHGGASDYVLPAHHGPIRTFFPRSSIESIPGAGHWLHAEQPEAVARHLVRFLD